MFWGSVNKFCEIVNCDFCQRQWAISVILIVSWLKISFSVEIHMLEGKISIYISHHLVGRNLGLLSEPNHSLQLEWSVKVFQISVHSKLYNHQHLRSWVFFSMNCWGHIYCTFSGFDWIYSPTGRFENCSLLRSLHSANWLNQRLHSIRSGQTLDLVKSLGVYMSNTICIQLIQLCWRKVEH